MMPQTFANVVRSVALGYGQVPSGHEINHILWEHTGYPAFFRRGQALEHCTEQVVAYYTGDSGRRPDDG